MTPIHRSGHASPICVSKQRVEPTYPTARRASSGDIGGRSHGQRLAWILCQKLFHARQRTGDVFLAIGIGNTNVPLPQRAEIRPPNRGHTRLLKQLAGQLLSFPAGLGDIGKGIKGALRRDARDPGDVIELRDHRFAPRVELRHHLSDCSLWTGQRLNPKL